MNMILILTQIKVTILGFAEAVLALRIIPTVIVFFYSFFVWKVWVWFAATQNPSTNAVAAFTAVLGIAAAVFGFYINGGNKFDWGRFDNVKNNVSQKLFAARRGINMKENTDKPID